MRSTFRNWTRAQLAFVAAVVLLAGTACGQAPVSPSGSGMPTPSGSQPEVTASSGVPSASPSSFAEMQPGRPYDAAEILEAMRESRRPGGVPDSIETQLVAEGVADAIWTLDGREWDAIAIGGSCGPANCSLDVVGTRPTAADDDLLTFSASPQGTSVTLETTHMGALPAALLTDLDRLARRLAGSAPVTDLRLASAIWLPPLDGETFQLAYRSGNEEESCQVDIALDVERQEVLSEQMTGC